MVAVDPGHATMAMAHVFAQANVGHDNELAAARFDRADGFLDDAVFGVGATGLFVFLPRNSKEQDRLKPQVLGAFCFVRDFAGRELKNAGHAANRLPAAQFFADEKGEDEVVDGELRLANKIPHPGTAPETPRTMNELSHGLRLSVRGRRRKFARSAGLDAAGSCSLNAAHSMRRAGKRSTDYLLIDVSNSFVKLAFATRDRIGPSTRRPTAGLTTSAIREILRRRTVSAIVVSSVVPSKNQTILSAAGRTRTLFLNPNLDLGVGIDYPAPRTIGADRLANAVAVAQLYGTPAIVVDFGTAVTFDVVSADANYVGGVIAPGLEAMTNFLYQRTALLPKLTLREPRRAIGKTTRDAMLSGAVHGYRGLVHEILTRLVAENFRRKKPRIVGTGGYAQLIAEKLPEIEAVHPNLTLEGLRIVANRNIG